MLQMRRPQSIAYYRHSVTQNTINIVYRLIVFGMSCCNGCAKKRCQFFHNHRGVQQISEFMVSEKKIDPLVLNIM